MTTFDNPYASPPEVKDYFGTAQSTDVLATRSERFAGAFIDGLVQAILILPGSFALGVVLFATVGADNADKVENSLAAKLIGSIGGFVIAAGAFLLINGYLLATRGQTVGKVLMKTKIVSDGGDQVEFGKLVLRRYLPLWLLGSIPWIGPLFGLANALAIFRKTRKCIHDDIAGTKVIKLPA